MLQKDTGEALLNKKKAESFKTFKISKDHVCKEPFVHVEYRKQVEVEMKADVVKINPLIGVELIFFVITMALGLMMVGYSEPGGLSRKVAAETLWAGGMIPLYGQILKLIESKGDFMALKTPNNGLSVLFLVTSAILQHNPDGGYMNLIGKPLLEAGVIYVVFRLLFLKEGQDMEIEQLKERNEALSQSVSIGCADNYFFNFVLPVVTALNDYDIQAETPNCVLVEKDENTKKEIFNDGFTLKESMVHIVIPVSMNTSVENKEINEISNAMRALQDKKKVNIPVVEGQLKPFRNQGRKFFVKFISREENQLNGLFDSPTGLSLLVRNLSAYDVDKRNNKLHEELEIFVSRLAWLIEKNACNKFVKIALIKDFDDIKWVGDRLKDMLTKRLPNNASVVSAINN